MIFLKENCGIENLKHGSMMFLKEKNS